MGHITQTLDLILISKSYNIIPYLRYEVAFKYWILLSGNYWDDAELKDIIIKSSVAYVFCVQFDKDISHKMDFLDYNALLIKNNFSKKVFSDINNFDFETMGLSEIREILKEKYSQAIQH